MARCLRAGCLASATLEVAMETGAHPHTDWPGHALGPRALDQAEVRVLGCLLEKRIGRTAREPMNTGLSRRSAYGVPAPYLPCLLGFSGPLGRRLWQPQAVSATAPPSSQLAFATRGFLWGGR